MTYYVTKYALSKGITVEELEPVMASSSATSTYLKRRDRYHVSMLRLGADCFPTWLEAVANAEARRSKKIASLKKQVAKLRALEFPRP